MKKTFSRIFSSLFAFLALVVVIFPADAASHSSLTSSQMNSLDSSKIVFREIASGFTQPLFITHAGDGSGRIFIVERAGQIRILNNGVMLSAPFLDIHTIVKSSSSEQGLLALAFHPSYETNGEFYVVYTAPRSGDASGSNLVLEKFFVSADPDQADSNSGVILLTISHPTYSNHNGGTLAFGQDGYLYWSTGDGGSGGDPNNNAQNLNSLLGKILRLDVDLGPPYIPTDNPFYGNTSPTIRKEIWAYGLRNPWRFSFDRLTNDAYIGDVGQGNREEISFQPASSTGGENYGWRIMEGTLCYNPSSGCNSAGKVLPVAQYEHSVGCSITGGYVYRGTNYPALDGYYFFGDYCTGVVFSLYKDINSGWTKTQIADLPYNISTFGEDEQGDLYFSNYSSGRIYQIQYQSIAIVNSITRADPNPTNVDSVDFTVTFSENVTGVDLSDFLLTTSVSGATLSGVSGSGGSYTVTVNTGSGDGTILLDVVDDDTIMNTFSNPLGGPGLGNGDFDSGESYTIDKTPPTVLSIIRANASPTAGVSVNFTVSFSEFVLGVDKGDFTLSSTDVIGPIVKNLSGAGAIRTVTVFTGSGDGTIRLNLVDDNTIIDSASNPLGGTGAGNGDFTTGETYAIDKPDLPAPTLRSPRSRGLTTDNLPSFWWTSVEGGQSYEIQFAQDNTFTVNVNSEMVSGSPYTVAIPLGDATYYWRVRAYNASNKSSAWSSPRILTIDTTAPPIPVLSSPANNASRLRAPIFKWQSTAGATYQFQYDNNSNFSSSIYTVSVRNNFRRPPAMKIGTYYWRVRAKDAVGNWSVWSAPFTITITGP